MKIKKNTFSTLAFELFFQSIANCKKSKVQKIQKSTSPTVQGVGENGSFHPLAEALVMALKLWGLGLKNASFTGDA
jgi:hypothetical protein